MCDKFLAIRKSNGKVPFNSFAFLLILSWVISSSSSSTQHIPFFSATLPLNCRDDISRCYRSSGEGCSCLLVSPSSHTISPSLLSLSCMFSPTKLQMFTLHENGSVVRRHQPGRLCRRCVSLHSTCNAKFCASFFLHFNFPLSLASRSQ